MGCGHFHHNLPIIYILVVYGKHTKQVAEAGSVSHMAFNYFCAKLITRNAFIY